MEGKKALINAITKELSIQKNFLSGEEITSIYLGGGTPSLLSEKELSQILNAVILNFEIKENPEITLEANPDDLTEQKIIAFKNASVNRLSIGIQSFHDPHLKFMNRAHNALEALKCVELARKHDITNLSVDLIYGIPAKDHQIWKNDLQKAIELDIPHISAYCLTIEPKTVFGNWLKKGKLASIDEEFSATQFEYMLKRLSDNGFEQYEISNFAKNKEYSQHNSSYWQQKKYLGVGPSAHSFDGINRQFNIANNQKYLQSIATGKIPFTKEILTNIQVVNEYLLTTLRTTWGSHLSSLNQKYPGWEILFKDKIQKLKSSNHLEPDEKKLILTPKGRLLADEITLSLFLGDD